MVKTIQIILLVRKFQNDFILKFRRFGQKFVFQINNYYIIIYLNI